VGGVFVGGETGTVGGYLEQYAAWLPKVDGPEIESVYARRHANTRRSKVLAPSLVLLIVRHSKRDVMHASASEMRRWSVGLLDQAHPRTRATRPYFVFAD
jgi:hypothetical protein